MFRCSSRLTAVAALGLACALYGPACAESAKGKEEIGGGAGHSPPIDMPEVNGPPRMRSLKIVPNDAAPAPETAVPQEKREETSRPPQDGDDKPK